MDEQHYEYRTGRTHPREKHNGIIAILLILVIFLAGLVSALGLLNIHLFRLLDAQKDASPLSFSQEAANGEAQTDDTGSMELKGMTVQEVPPVYQKMYDLPAGLYISRVAPGSVAESVGIVPGDVLTCFAGTPVSKIDTLQSLLDGRTPGKPLTITAFRDGQELHFTITVD